MAYYESFWVVVGTAAPVIALAAVVSSTDAGGESYGLNELVTNTAHSLRHSAEPDPVKVSELKTAQTIARVLSWGFLLQLGNVFLQGAALTLSLSCLAVHRNVIPPYFGIVAVSLGMLLLAWVGLKILNAKVARIRIQQVEGSPKKGGNGDP